MANRSFAFRQIRHYHGLRSLERSTGFGMMTVEALQQRVKNQEIETVIVCFPDLYGRLMGKRYDAEHFVHKVAGNGSAACSYLLTTDMNMNPIQGMKLASWDTGFGDFGLSPDISTLRHASWLDNTAVVICDLTYLEGGANSIEHSPGEPVKESPREILKTQLRRAKEMGFDDVAAASELEYFVFKTNYETAHKSSYTKLDALGWYSEDYHILQGTRGEAFNGLARHHLKVSGIPVENTKGETGIGQHELNISYGNVVDMSDKHVIFKQCLKEIADQLGFSVTFMAKPFTTEAGSSSHLHVNLMKNGSNAFVGSESLDDVHKCSADFRHFLAGWVHYTREMLPMYAPTINSYKRFKSGTWAPVATAWSIDNRTTGFRIVGNGSKAIRIECRLPGADVNPYLAYAAVLASGLEGIRQKMEPPPMFRGNNYGKEESEDISLPKNLMDAVRVFEKSAFVKQSFGQDVQQHLSKFFRNEAEDFARHVTDWEMKRYFEQI